MLHGARAERIDPGVDGIIVAREANVVAHSLWFGETRQIESALARVRTQSRLERRWLLNIDA